MTCRGTGYVHDPRPAPGDRRHSFGFELQASQSARARSDQHGDPGLRGRPDQGGDAEHSPSAHARIDGAELLLQIHDELGVEVPPEERHDVAALVHEEMTTPLAL